MILEIIAVVLALLYLILAAYQSIWCWLAAALSSLIYIKICIDSHLYIESGLQVFYFIMAIVGYVNWNKSNKQKKVSDLSLKEWIVGILIFGTLSLATAYWFEQNTKAALPWFDAPVTIFSLWATWLVVKKILQNWLLWIVIDATAVYIYINRGLNLTAALYALYTILAFIGYFKWKKVQQQYIK